jgi:putative spermidine/putrescine transport system permease protein
MSVGAVTSEAKPRRNVLSKIVNVGLGFWTAALIFSLYAPFLIMFVLSFNDLRGGSTFPMRGFGLGWWRSLWDPTIIAEVSGTGGGYTGTYWQGLRISLTLAVMTMITSTVLATLAALAFHRRFRGSSVIFYLFLMAMIVPGLIVGLGLALFYDTLDVRLRWYTTTFGVHVMWTLPFCFLIMLVTFNRFDRTLEDAALNLGADEFQTFFQITLPMLAPGILSSLLFGFTLSFDELIRSLLVTGQDNTLPLLIWGTLQVRVTPRLYALGSLTTLISLTVLLVYFVAFARSRRAEAS